MKKPSKKLSPVHYMAACLFVFLAASAHASGIDGGYVGTAACLTCHDGSAATNKMSFQKTGHPYKYRHTGGSLPTDPLTGLFPRPPGLGLDTLTLGEDCGDGLIVCDGSLNLDWSAINYAIGGYGWKIRWGVNDPAAVKTGYVWTGTSQYNLENGSWSAYNANTDKKNECATCHQTNGSIFTYGYSCYTDPLTSNRSEPLLTNPGMELEEIAGDGIGNDDTVCETGEACKIGGYRSQWTFDGVQCEACHGKGSNAGSTGHADAGASVTQSVLTLSGGVEICAKCHIRAENTAGTGAECGGDANPAILTNGAKIADPFINHHEQYNEMHGLSEDGVHQSLTCVTCHDPHKRAVGVIGAVATALGITGDNTNPEPGAIRKQCADCHKAQADADAASALANPTGKHGDHASVTCVDCHMAEATKTAINYSTAGWGRKGDLKTHIFDINPTGSSIVRSNGFTNVAQNYITPKYACGKCHDSNIYGSVIAGPTDEATAQTESTGYHNVTGIDSGYVGSTTCAGCHAAEYDEFTKSGHPYKVRMTAGATPTGSSDPLSALLTSSGDNTIVSVAALNADASVPTSQIDSDSDGKLDWAAVNYVIGGFGWKARWGIKDSTGDDKSGYVWSAASLVGGYAAQFNMLAADPTLDPASKRADWSTYGSSSGQSKKYECAICHNTNGIVSTSGYSCYTDPGTDLSPARTEPWASTGMSPVANHGGFYSSWSLTGVQCEACHGTGVNHVKDPSGNNMGLSTSKDACGKCHIRAENTAGQGAECGGDANPAILTNGAKISGDYIQHHEQYNELVGLKIEDNGAAGGDNDGVCEAGEVCKLDGAHASRDCVDCHEPHTRSHKVTGVVAAALNISDNDESPEERGAVVSCDSCHPGKTLKYPMADTTCVDCHMAEATKSATNESPDGAWGRMGDVKTHIFKINPAATTITRVNGDSVNVATNALSVKYACGKCHDSSMGSYVGNGAMTEAAAKSFAADIHHTKPYVSFGYTTSGLTVNVNAAASSCVSGSCLYEWNWGDGAAYGSGVSTSHPYGSAGTRTVTLTVKDGVEYSSNTKSVSVTVYAADPPPTISATCALDTNWVETVTPTVSGDTVMVTVNWGDGGMLAV
ncbi:MAG: PKD domain-containing protein, partial [Deltaproteobacteria bacterium]|nr:PKD domain-containing protein [Deltaproteobacteria bacterium]